MQQKSRNLKSNTSSEVGRFAVLMAFGTLASRILGFVRDMMMATYFSRTVTDAWLVAFRLPNLFRRLFGEGALSVSFIPVFVGLLTEENKSKNITVNSESHKLANGVFTVLLCILIPLVSLGIIYSGEIIRLLTPGDEYTKITGKVELTIKFARIMFVFILFVCIYALYMSILNSLKKFLLPAFAPALWNLSLIVSAFLPVPGAKESGEVLAWAVVIGGFLQMAILIPALYKEGFLPTISFAWKTESFKAVMKGLCPSILGLSVMQITILVNTRFASYLPEGTNSWIFWSDRILELPLSLFAVSLGTALLPTLSYQWRDGKQDDFHETSNFYLRAIFALAIPAAAGLWCLARPIVDLLFLRGQFTSKDAEFTASVLQVYSVAVISASGVRVIAPCFYAIKNTWYPAICSLLGLVLHVIFAPILIAKFGVVGLVSSTVGSATVNLLSLLAGYRYFIGYFDFYKLAKSILYFSCLGVIMGLMLNFYWIPIYYYGNALIVRFVSLLLTCSCAGTTYLFLAHVCHLEEIKPITSKIINKLK